LLRRAAVVLLLSAGCAVPALADGEAELPDFVPSIDHGDIEVDPRWRHDGALQARLDAAVTQAGLQPLVRAGHCGIALVDLADTSKPLIAEVRGGEMIYAASMPKIGVLYAAFQARKEGRLKVDEPLRCTLTDMCRVSSNQAATECIRRVGIGYIASVLCDSGLYDPEMGGGLWVGKAYGSPDDLWHRDPVADLSHGATAVSVARLLTLLAQERLVDAQSSREMLEILSNPGIHHKFVKGLDSRPSTIYRKSGSWHEWHGDAALVERAGKRYVAVALLQSTDGERILEDLILRLDDCIPENPSVRIAMAPAAAHESQPSGL
jgi:beta-lactamase class A